MAHAATRAPADEDEACDSKQYPPASRLLPEVRQTHGGPHLRDPHHPTGLQQMHLHVRLTPLPLVTPSTAISPTPLATSRETKVLGKPPLTPHRVPPLGSSNAKSISPTPTTTVSPSPEPVLPLAQSPPPSLAASLLCSRIVSPARIVAISGPAKATGSNRTLGPLLATNKTSDVKGTVEIAKKPFIPHRRAHSEEPPKETVGKGKDVRKDSKDEDPTPTEPQQASKLTQHRPRRQAKRAKRKRANPTPSPPPPPPALSPAPSSGNLSYGFPLAKWKRGSITITITTTASSSSIAS